jgi:8-oxo-dGTP pyrophosphatase MutT (NUDIX family)
MALERRAARIFVIADESVLLIRGCDPAHPENGEWWLTPGGGVDDGEAIPAAATRELREETGLELDVDQIGPVVATRVTEFDFGDVAHHQAEWYFAVHVPRFEPEVDGWDELEQQALLEFRWWTVPELGATTERVYPQGLVDAVRALIAGPVDEPMVLSAN